MAKTFIAAKVSKIIEVKLNIVYQKLYRFGIKANHLTLSQLPLIALMVYEAYQKNIELVIKFSIIMLVIDAIDGPFARATNSVSKTGHLYDRVIDFLSINSLAWSIGTIFSELLYLSLILMVATFFLYILNEVTKTEIWSTVRVLVPIGAVFNVFLWPLLISLIITILVILNDIYKLLKIKKGY